MSQWIYVTNLPLYYDELSIQEMFSGLGQITATKIRKDALIFKSTALLQFAHSKYAKLAASKRDQTVIGKSAIRVFLVWCKKETLSTIKVLNIPPHSTPSDIEKYCNPYGDVVNIAVVSNNTANAPDTAYALVSFSRVDYALLAAQEMDQTIVASGAALSVQLLNPDARNLQWKRHSFEYVSLNAFDTALHTNNIDSAKYGKYIYRSPTSTNDDDNETHSFFPHDHKPTAPTPSDSVIDLKSVHSNTVHSTLGLLITGFIRKHWSTHTAMPIPLRISTITHHYFHSQQPLYLTDPRIPAPPSRTPPCPPAPNSKTPQIDITRPMTTHTDCTPKAEPASCKLAPHEHGKATPMDTEVEEEETVIIGKDEDADNKDQQMLDVYRTRLDLIESKLLTVGGQFEHVSSSVNTHLLSLETRRINDINTIQKQFNSTITALCYQINNQINTQIKNLSNKLESNRMSNVERIEQLEEKLVLLQKENDALRKQQKINKILKLQQQQQQQSPHAQTCTNAVETGTASTDSCSEHDKVQQWLTEIVRLPQYFGLLLENGYDDLESIEDLTVSELQQIGIEKVGHRKKLIKYAGKLRQHRAAERQDETSPHFCTGSGVNSNENKSSSLHSPASSRLFTPSPKHQRAGAGTASGKSSAVQQVSMVSVVSNGGGGQYAANG
eukprot:CAMPEP_0197036396 /NCGR_PEP_ID=MMETSP1384-20130603/13906_1 /TAXON_ID=29189 /ORGANISM="Ammonia sp." /LENGTH=667 /DNA_ID=CAMNT_0042466573 /DNA_START=33 /DNA_END=2032 /DNA_ORIENTATION=-